jgi:hypothetical protein
VEGDIVRHHPSGDATAVDMRYNEEGDEIVTLKLKSGKAVRLRHRPGMLEKREERS